MLSGMKYQKLPTENQDGDCRKHENGRKNYQTNIRRSTDDYNSKHDIAFKQNGLYRNSFNSYGNESFDEYRDNDSDVSLSSGDIEGEDEVFIADPRKKWKQDWEEATKPLMPPRGRRRIRFGNHKIMKCCNSFCRPDCIWKTIYMVIFVATLAAFVCLVVYLLETFIKTDESRYVIVGNFSDTLPRWSSNFSGESTSKTQGNTRAQSTVIGCSEIETEGVWTIGFPKLTTESSFRLVDVNKDGTLDVIFGFGTGADGVNMPEIVCDLYFQGSKPCGGGMIALDGKTGKEIWRHFTKHEVFGVNCNEDLNSDDVPDCLSGGRGGVLELVSGTNGKALWSFRETDKTNVYMNFYTAQFTRDMNGDNVLDVLTVHGGDPMREKGEPVKLPGRIKILSGKDGTVLQDVIVPDRKESYYSPQIVRLADGHEMVLFGTGGETHGGSLWTISLSDLYSGKIQKSTEILHDDTKGVMTPPVLVDLNQDGVEDIVIPLFNSSLFAVDGATYKILWQKTFENSESYNTPSAGYFNDDDVPDFMVKYAYGPGFPVYLYSVTTVLDGKSGAPLLTPYIKDTIGSQASPLTISVEGRGNDVFLYWLSDCLKHSGRENEKFYFTQGTTIHEQTRADFCKMRFNSNVYTSFMVYNRHSTGIGKEIYNSLNKTDVEHRWWVNTTQEALDYVLKHPDVWNDYLYYTDYLSKHEQESQKDDDDRTPRVDSFETPKGKTTAQTTMLKNDLPMETGKNRGQFADLGRNPDTSNTHRLYDTSMKKKNRFKSLLDEDTLKSYLGLGKNTATGYFNEDGDPVNSKLRLPVTYQRQNLPYRKSMSLPQQDYLSSYLQDDLDGSSQYNRKVQPDYGLWLTSRNGGNVPDDWRRDKPRDWERDGVYAPRSYDFLNQNRRQRRAVKKTDSSFQTTKLKILKRMHRARHRRHIGPHDDSGIQRLLSTGTLAPPTLDVNHPEYNHSMDVIFATYWFYPTKVKALFPKDQECVDQKMKNQTARFSKNSKYFGMDSDAYVHTIQKECLALRQGSLGASDGHAVHSHPSNVNPYDIPMGQLTVYRVRIKCKCSQQLSPGERCSRILPHDQQQWGSYMGSRGDGHWRSRTGM